MKLKNVLLPYFSNVSVNLTLMDVQECFYSACSYLNTNFIAWVCALVFCDFFPTRISKNYIHTSLRSDTQLTEMELLTRTAHIQLHTYTVYCVAIVCIMEVPLKGSFEFLISCSTDSHQRMAACTNICVLIIGGMASDKFTSYSSWARLHVGWVYGLLQLFKNTND